MVQHLRFTRIQMRGGETSKHVGEEDGPLLHTPPRELSGGQPLHRQEVGVRRRRVKSAAPTQPARDVRDHLLPRPIRGGV